MRILLVNSVRAMGGGTSSTVELARGLALVGNEIAMVCNPGGEIAHTLADDPGVQIVPVRIGSDFGPFAIASLARVVRRFAPDVILADRRKDVKLTVLARSMVGNTPVVHRHGAPSTLRDSAVYRFFWRRVHTLIVNSFAMRERLLEEARWLEQIPIEVIHNGIDLDHFRPMPEARERVRDSLSIPDRAVVIAFHGVLQERKRVNLLLRAVAGLPRGAGVHLLVVGKGPEEGRLRAEAATLGLAATFTGKRPDIPELLSAVDIYVHLSISEGFSNSVVEALACGLPVIASDTTSHPEQIDPGRTGLLVSVSGHSTVTDALNTLINDTSSRSEMGKAARLAAERRFDRRTMINRYQEVLARAAPTHLLGRQSHP
jgi:glycosyltransferase involved in cell wall biosynthesis